MPAPKGNQNAAKAEPADSYLHVRIQRRRKAAYVRAAFPGQLAEWVVGNLDKAANYKHDDKVKG